MNDRNSASKFSPVIPVVSLGNIKINPSRIESIAKKLKSKERPQHVKTTEASPIHQNCSPQRVSRCNSNSMSLPKIQLFTGKSCATPKKKTNKQRELVTTKTKEELRANKPSHVSGKHSIKKTVELTKSPKVVVVERQSSKSGCEKSIKGKIFGGSDLPIATDDTSSDFKITHVYDHYVPRMDDTSKLQKHDTVSSSGNSISTTQSDKSKSQSDFIIFSRSDKESSIGTENFIKSSTSSVLSTQSHQSQISADPKSQQPKTLSVKEQLTPPAVHAPSTESNGKSTPINHDVSTWKDRYDFSTESDILSGVQFDDVISPLPSEDILSQDDVAVALNGTGLLGEELCDAPDSETVTEHDFDASVLLVDTEDESLSLKVYEPELLTSEKIFSASTKVFEAETKAEKNCKNKFIKKDVINENIGSIPKSLTVNRGKTSLPSTVVYIPDENEGDHEAELPKSRESFIASTKPFDAEREVKKDCNNKFRKKNPMKDNITNISKSFTVSSGKTSLTSTVVHISDENEGDHEAELPKSRESFIASTKPFEAERKVKKDDNNKFRKKNVMKDNITNIPKSFTVCSETSLTSTVVHIPDEKESDSFSSSSQKNVILSKKKLKQQKIRALERKLARMEQGINRFASVELTFNDMEKEDSAYLLEAKLKEDFVQTWRKYCRLIGDDPDAHISVKKKVRVKSSPIPELNRAVEKFINRRDIFPNIFEVKQVCLEANDQCDLNLKLCDLHKFAVDIFSEVGAKLQKNRQKDFRKTWGNPLTDCVKIEDDPAEFDHSLKRQLKQNRKIAKAQSNKVFEEFARLQYEQESNSREDEELSENEDEDFEESLIKTLHQKQLIENKHAKQEFLQKTKGKFEKKSKSKQTVIITLSSTKSENKEIDVKIKTPTVNIKTPSSSNKIALSPIKSPVRLKSPRIVISPIPFENGVYSPRKSQQQSSAINQGQNHEKIDESSNASISNVKGKTRELNSSQETEIYRKRKHVSISEKMDYKKLKIDHKKTQKINKAILGLTKTSNYDSAKYSSPLNKFKKSRPSIKFSPHSTMTSGRAALPASPALPAVVCTHHAKSHSNENVLKGRQFVNGSLQRNESIDVSCQLRKNVVHNSKAAEVIMISDDED